MDVFPVKNAARHSVTWLLIWNFAWRVSINAGFW
jgi:hypothetical protein